MDDLCHTPPTWQQGEGEMIRVDLWTAIHARARRGEAKQKIARELGGDRKTVRRLLPHARPMRYQRTVSRPALVSPSWAYLQRRVTEVDDHAARIFQELKAQGEAGGDAMVKLAVRPLRAERDRLAEATLRCDTGPGRQAQGAWGSSWAAMGGQRVRVQRLVMVLGDSRRLSVEGRRDQTLGRLLACPQHAFDWCGGLTAEIRSEHPNTVVLKRDGEGRVIEGHPQGGDVARDDGVTPRLCRPYRAQTQGKVAAGSKARQAQLRAGASVSPLGHAEPVGAGVGADGGRSARAWDQLPQTGGGVSGGTAAASSRPSPLLPLQRAVSAGGPRWCGDGAPPSRRGAPGLCRPDR